MRRAFNCSPKVLSFRSTARCKSTLPVPLVGVLREHRKDMLEQALRLGIGKVAERLAVRGADGGPLSPNAVSAAWAHFADNIGQPDVTFHALRHTHASQLIATGKVDIVTISKRLGHAEPDTTLRVYAHMFHRSEARPPQPLMPRSDVESCLSANGVIGAVRWQSGGNRSIRSTFVPQPFGVSY